MKKANFAKVIGISIHKSKFYECSICGLKYKERKWAKKCEEWCRKYKSCNLEITKHAVKNAK